VPDLGPGVRQYIRIFNRDEAPWGLQCWFDPGAFADVQPGKVVDAGKLTTLQATNCPLAFQPTWDADGTALNYLLRDSRTNSNRPTNISQIAANPPPTAIGDLVLNMGQFLTLDKLYMLARSTVPARRDQLLFVQDNYAVTPIYLGTIDDLATATAV